MRDSEGSRLAARFTSVGPLFQNPALDTLLVANEIRTVKATLLRLASGVTDVRVSPALHAAMPEQLSSM